MINDSIRDVFLGSVQAVFDKGDDKTSSGLKKAAAVARQSVQQMLGNISDDDYADLLAEVQSKVSVVMNLDGGCIVGSQEYKHWLKGAKAEIKWSYWDRYRQYLKTKKSWPLSVVKSLDEASDVIVDLAGDPRSQNSFLRKGLVIGDVQSGKTATYTAILNKAADVGYKVIIVLTGMLEDLRRQTQARLDAEFSGYSSDKLNNPSKRGPKKRIGVGIIDRSISVAPFTSTLGDFDTATANKVQLDIKDISAPVLFVIKKQKDVLRNLASWLEKSVDERTGKIMHPLLIIDDEADNASVNTSKEDNSPTTINKGIRRLMDMFYKTAYIGVTATPFANIFIQPDKDDKREADDKEAAEWLSKEDLFPSDFIYALQTPSNYIGAVKIFGDGSNDESNRPDNEDMLEEINANDMEKILPYRHKKEWIVTEIPSDLKKALCYFILINAVRDYRASKSAKYRSDKKTHRSMMVHVSRFTAVQGQVYNLIDEWLYNVKSDIRNYAVMPADKIVDNQTLKELRSVYEDMLAAKTGIKWEQLRKTSLRTAVEPIELRLQNSEKRKDNSKNLDYSAYKEGLRVIAIGGNSFARGLTLEGLCVTFFYRRSLMYDTLMQMGRWFGYRPLYEDLCKIWLAPDAIGWYRYITAAIEELKDQIREMQRQDRTPSDFGLKVRRHPASLIVTARNKMRTATQVRRAVSLSQRYLESARLLDKKEVLDANYELFQKFIKKLPAVRYEGNDVDYTSKLFWRGINGLDVADMIRNFVSSNWSMAFQSKAVSDYISQNLSGDIWDVMIAGGKGTTFRLTTDHDNLQINPVKRKITKVNDNILISGSKVRIGSVAITKNGLTDEKVKAVEAKYNIEKAGKCKTIPSSGYMIEDRNPLLILYFIEPEVDPKNEVDLSSLPQILCGLGVGLPSTGKEDKTVDYVVNLVEIKNEYGDYTDEEE